MKVISVPDSLDARTLDSLVDAVAKLEEGEKSLLDARHLRWIDPVGMTGILACGVESARRCGERPRFEPPDSSEVRGYLARMGFYAAAEPVLTLDGKAPRRSGQASEVLLELTSISENQDVHAVVDRVQSRAGAILSESLGYPPTAVVQFSVILSEVCQNIVEHAESVGWVAAQTYSWSRRLGRNVVVISVADVGRGFRGSLAPEHAARFGDRWGDATALEAAFIHGITRFPESGRGQGIQQIRKQVRRWDGMITVRSGTARIADVPPWYEAPPLEEGLSPLGGAQISIVLPARADEHAGDTPLGGGGRGEGRRDMSQPDSEPMDSISVDVSRIVQRTVASLYSHLVTRPTGRAVRLAIEGQVSQAGERALSLVDLSEVTILDFSCADEVVAKLLLRFAERNSPVAYFVFRGVQEVHRGPIQAVLERQSLAAVAESDDGHFELLGSVTAEERMVWEEIESLGRLDASEVGRHLPTPHERETLERLVRRRVVMEVPDCGEIRALSTLIPPDGA